MSHDERFDEQPLPPDPSTLAHASRRAYWTSLRARAREAEAELFGVWMESATSPVSQVVALDVERALHFRRLVDLHGASGAQELLLSDDEHDDRESALLVDSIRGSVVRAAALEIEIAATR